MYEGGGSDGDRCATGAKGTPNTGPAPTHHRCAREPRPPRRTPRRPPIYIYTSSGERGSVCRREDPAALSAAAAAAAAAHAVVGGRRHDTTAYHTNGWKTTHLMSNNTYTCRTTTSVDGDCVGGSAGWSARGCVGRMLLFPPRSALVLQPRGRGRG